MFFLLQRVFLSNKLGKVTKSLAVWAKLKASAGRMLCMPDLNTQLYGKRGQQRIRDHRSSVKEEECQFKKVD